MDTAATPAPPQAPGANGPTPPTLECDLVMKGGISSGIVYPRAAAHLAKTYRFRSVGGTSAGAIAAVAVAAAEHGRGSGGFAKLEVLPTALGTGLGDLFQAGPATRPALTMLLGWLEPGRSRRARLLRTLVALVSCAPRTVGLVFAALVLLPGWLFLWVGAGEPWRTWVAVGIAATIWLPVAAVLALALAVRRFAKDTRAGMEANGFGLCDGHTADPRVGHDPLTDWLADLVDDLAGLPRRTHPLTFGELWGPAAVDAAAALERRTAAGERVSIEEVAAAGALRAVDLKVMTTCLTFQRPYQFPFTTNVFLFCPEHLAQYFPDHVMSQLINTSTQTEDVPDEPDGVIGNRVIATICPDHGTRLRHLPAAADLPVIMAARLSLSFPGLISAIPLHCIDWSRAVGRREVITVWFSDGGIASNFPMHFFDRTLPMRPTFGINLRPRDPDRPNEMVWKPPKQGVMARVPDSTPIGGLVEFAHSILSTMQEWVDNTLITMPGYRDRIVTLRQGPGEGGMNLAMPPQVVENLADRGAKAAALLDDFDLDLHRWIRYRVTLGGADEMLTGIKARYDGGFGDFVQRYSSVAEQFAHRETDPAKLTGCLRGLVDLAGVWAADAHPAQAEPIPAPRPELRFMPRQ